ncbi:MULTISPECIES: SpoIIIAH-like family protein [Anaerostipes]|uniref:SpoIIIAH-like family protein n=1 Tax=Anaerostipes TaxID=207244 RepID=UPI000951BC04|nr:MULTISPECIES: SpoIIIAH-like family protein [Anaerostipes]MCI5623266.1 SpoIIIAH-like family protein [Anaerostipes sp.]MDY2726557.1 SpoIIIAH-like family protein [Anaerostipes faecalis]OLR58609.1 hypothetical protein BHF70_02595 [Anaerostipes sp. 494a]
MKKIIRKNQMIIMTLAVIIAVAGYVNYSGKYESVSKSKTKTVSNTVKETSGQVKDDITDIGEAVLTNAQVSNYVAKAKLEREQTHSKAKDTLEEIINDKTVKDSVKQDAVDKLSSLAEQMEMETATENLLGAKGFLNSIVTISNGNVDVLVNKKNLSKIERSQIEDIVVRKTGFQMEDIVITSIKTDD